MEPEETKKTQKTIGEKEQEILQFWNENKIFEKSLFENEGNTEGQSKQNFTFYDGPPFATGLPHHGHLMQSYIKDSIPRYQTMNGKKVRRVWGWDTHGLPLENIVEKELGLKSKQEIVEYGVDKFTKAAKEMVMKYEDDWKKVIPRIGRWVDMDNRYMTLSNTYTESCWWAFSELYKKGLAYEGFKVMHICPRCETPLAASEVALGYVDLNDISVYAKFELIDEAGTYLLAWTTTPWTLPGNTAIAINKNLEYVKVKVGEEFFIVAKNLVNKIFGEELGSKALPYGDGMGEALIGKKYKPVFNYFNNPEYIGNLKNVFGEKNGENIYKVWHADFVTDNAGTGIAHEAPAFGEDDYNLAMQNNIPTILHVGMDGRFTQEVTDFAGERVKWKGETQATDKKICEFLQNQNLILKTEVITHSYPLCWRCDTPLLNYATNSWFVAVSKMRDRLVEENNNVYWVPDNVRTGRMGKWLEGSRDWALSRNRYWGAPLPVWKSTGEHKEVFVPSGLKDLQTRTKSKNKYIFIRHGETDANRKNIELENENNVAGGIIDVVLGSDLSLNDTGRQQANNIKLDNVDVIISSPYKRAIETAEIVAGNLGFDKSKIEISENLKEWQVGSVNNGKTWVQFYEENKGVNYLHHKVNVGEETKIDVQNRVAKLIGELEENYEGKTILLITHKSPISATLSRNAGEIFEMGTKNMPVWKNIKNCEVVEIDWKPLPTDEVGAINFHLPHIDNLKVYDNKGELMKREGGVFDCWYESGSMPFAQFHYPFENQELFKNNFPADFIAEAQDQTRGWFYTMLILGVGLFDRSPFKSVITSGMINAADGKKMSKKLKNYTDPVELVEKYGSDSIRYYILSSPVVKGESVKFSDDAIKQSYSKNIGRLLNVLSFYKMTTENEGMIVGDVGSEHVIDKFIISRLKQLKQSVTKGFDELFLDEAFRPVEKFIDDLSVWYLRRSRERLKSENLKEKQDALKTLKYVSYELAKVLAPIYPFTSEMIWQEIRSEIDPISVHLANWGVVEELDTNDIENIEKMELVRDMVTNILEERVKNAVKVRQPLASVTFRTDKFNSIKNSGEYLGEVMDEVNIRGINFMESDADNKVCELDLNITEELKEEGVYRELVRMIQDKRKAENLKVSDQVNIILPDNLSDFEKQVIEKNITQLQRECGLKEISFGSEIKICPIKNT